MKQFSKMTISFSPVNSVWYKQKFDICLDNLGNWSESKLNKILILKLN